MINFAGLGNLKYFNKNKFSDSPYHICFSSPSFSQHESNKILASFFQIAENVLLFLGLDLGNFLFRKIIFFHHCIGHTFLHKVKELMSNQNNFQALATPYHPCFPSAFVQMAFEQKLRLCQIILIMQIIKQRCLQSTIVVPFNVLRIAHLYLCMNAHFSLYKDARDF